MNLLSHIRNSISLEGIEIKPIDREKYDGDFSLLAHSKLRALGKDAYIKNVIPSLIKEAERLSPLKIVSQGIYVNVTLPDEVIFHSLEGAGELDHEAKLGAGKTVVIEYSSPNVAKRLHAGHIRSTIIGHVIGNLYGAVGYNVHRINYINDWGGFGFLLAGKSRWPDLSPEDIYLKYRDIEEDGGPVFDAFKRDAEKRFLLLENGNAEERKIWKGMVDESIKQFTSFYELFDISFDEMTGESAFVDNGYKIVEDALMAGKADIVEGAPAVMVRDAPFYLRRSDGTTIYATRDLAALKDRTERFRPARLVYVVGEEQSEYFRRLFHVARELGFLSSGISPEHVSFGFYIDAESGKKLSSRAGAESVERLLDVALAHFSHREVAFGSLIFHDIKKDRKLAVSFSDDPKKNILEFEESGGAYLLYTVVRAKSVLRKSADASFVKTDCDISLLDNTERNLIKKLLLFPASVVRATEINEPSIVADYLLHLAEMYNSYYETYRVFESEKLAYPYRYVLTHKIASVLEKGLNLCHIKVPERM